ncbi:hypothetical protein FRZ06_03620 [Anoxybacterium hadale]|uniref:Uncharacterized protein n=1 Tax=Anoxybacterium hadale TaxID=3408580 RepID=A0ACD1A7Z1_9FIRM|nr:hypothetical protein FRZ06_03620 [Clostridiales bacterium]
MNIGWLEYWYRGIPMGLMGVFLTGIFIIKDRRLWVFSLQRRLELRSSAVLKARSSSEREFRQHKTGIFEMPSRIIRNIREQSMDKEILEAIAFLRNLATLGRGKTSSSDYIIERLSEHNGILQPVYVKMLSLLRMNQSTAAAEYFAKKVGTTAGRDFAGLLIQWDRLEPTGLLETLLSYEKSIKAVRVTYQKKRDEIVSELIYFPVVVNILAIFINFIYIAYFIDQKELLQLFM